MLQLSNIINQEEKSRSSTKESYMHLYVNKITHKKLEATKGVCQLSQTKETNGIIKHSDFRDT